MIVNVLNRQTTFWEQLSQQHLSFNINIISDRDSQTIFYQNILRITDHQNIVQKELAGVAHYHVNGEQILTGKLKVCVVCFTSINKSKEI